MPPTGTTAAMVDPQLMGATLGASGLAAHHAAHQFAAQQQHPHQHVSRNGQHALPSPSPLGLSQPLSAAPTPPSSAAQQAAAAAAAAAVAVQQLSNGGHFNGLGTTATNGVAGSAGASTSTSTSASASASDSASTSSPFSLDLITSLLGAGRVTSSGGSGDTGSDAAMAETAPLVGLVISQALAEVRNADQRGRDLMLVEIAAKQLALAIVRFGEGGAVVGHIPSGSGAAPAGNADDVSSNQHGNGPAAVE